MGYNPNICHFYKYSKVINHLLTIDPNFQRDIQVTLYYSILLQAHALGVSIEGLDSRLF